MDSRVAEIVTQFAAVMAVGGTWCLVAVLVAVALHQLLPKAKPSRSEATADQEVL